METLSTLTDIRDVVLIVFGIVAALTLIVTIIVIAAIGWGVYRLLGAGRHTLKDGLGPLLENAGGTARNFRVTSEYVSDTVVAPIIRVRSFVAGAKRALNVFGERKS